MGCGYVGGLPGPLHLPHSFACISTLSEHSIEACVTDSLVKSFHCRILRFHGRPESRTSTMLLVFDASGCNAMLSSGIFGFEQLLLRCLPLRFLVSDHTQLYSSYSNLGYRSISTNRLPCVHSILCSQILIRRVTQHHTRPGTRRLPWCMRQSPVQQTLPDL